jgi:hypothetical protein
MVFKTIFKNIVSKGSTPASSTITIKFPLYLTDLQGVFYFKGLPGGYLLGLPGLPVKIAE